MDQGGITINGNVGHAITAQAGSMINVYVTLPAQDDIEAKIRLIHLLLRKGELAGIRRMLENISFKLYGSRYFKSLTLEQLITLHSIADEVVEVLYRSRLMHFATAQHTYSPP